MSSVSRHSEEGRTVEVGGASHVQSVFMTTSPRHSSLDRGDIGGVMGALGLSRKGLSSGTLMFKEVDRLRERLIIDRAGLVGAGGLMGLKGVAQLCFFCNFQEVGFKKVTKSRVLDIPNFSRFRLL